MMNRQFLGHVGSFLSSMLLLVSYQAFALTSGPGAVSGVATSTDADPSNSPGQVLKRTLEITSGGPYKAKVGVPITLHGTYTVEGQTETVNQLKMIGQALQSYLQVNGTYPPEALLNSQGQPTVSWRVLILPYLGERELYERFDLTKPWNDPVNLVLLYEVPAAYRNGRIGTTPTDTGIAGVQGSGALFQNSSTRLNGGRPLSGVTQNEKIAAAPVGADVHLPWTAPGDLDIQTLGALGSPTGFSGDGDAFTPLLFLDGTVHLMPDDVGAGPVRLWARIPPPSGGICPCAPPSSVDAGIKAAWDLGHNGTFNTHGFDVTFLAPKAGKYTVTMQVHDNFGNEYNSSTKVEVR